MDRRNVRTGNTAALGVINDDGAIPNKCPAIVLEGEVHVLERLFDGDDAAEFRYLAVLPAEVTDLTGLRRLPVASGAVAALVRVQGPLCSVAFPVVGDGVLVQENLEWPLVPAVGRQVEPDEDGGFIVDVCYVELKIPVRPASVEGCDVPEISGVSRNGGSCGYMGGGVV
jgi:hypothetical protein